MMRALIFSFLCLALSTNGQYVQPPWFDRIREDFEAFVPGPVRRCWKREDSPPVPGETCAETPKTCFFGTQTCPDGELNPVTRCSCPGRPNNQWSCAPFSCESSTCAPPAPCPAVSEVVPENESNVDGLTGIVDFMNELRQSQIAGRELDPVPCRLPCLTWSEKLAENAIDSALTCAFLRNPDGSNSVPRLQTAVGTIVNLDTTNVVFGWFNQQGNYDYATNTCSSPGACGLYEQLVSDQIFAVGCAAVACAEIEGFPIRNSSFVLCLFEGRNVDGVRPYATPL